jgi:hypothetical protein
VLYRVDERGHTGPKLLRIFNEIGDTKVIFNGVHCVTSGRVSTDTVTVPAKMALLVDEGYSRSQPPLLAINVSCLLRFRSSDLQIRNTRPHFSFSGTTLESPRKYSILHFQLNKDG